MCEVLSSASVPNRFYIKDYNALMQSGIVYELPLEISALIQHLDQTTEIIDFGNSGVHTAKAPRNNGGNGFTHVSSANRPAKNFNNKHSMEGGKTNPPGRNVNGRDLNKKASPSLEDWGTARQFKTTKFDIKTGIDKLLNDIRIALNKISNSTYEKQRDAIIKLMHEIRENDLNDSSSDEEDEAVEKNAKRNGIQQVCNLLHDVAASNKFYSEMYAKLYGEIIQINEFSETFQMAMKELVRSFPSSLDNYVYVNEEDDSEEFYKMNKVNDKRKATATFIVNLMKLQTIPNEDVLNIISTLLQRILSAISSAEKAKEVEEIVENVFVIASNSKKILQESEQWRNEIDPHIKTLSNSSIKQNNPGITSRVVFKFMDLL